jgi:hypothetical protein
MSVVPPAVASPTPKTPAGSLVYGVEAVTARRAENESTAWSEEADHIVHEVLLSRRCNVLKDLH